MYGCKNSTLQLYTSLVHYLNCPTNLLLSNGSHGVQISVQQRLQFLQHRAALLLHLSHVPDYLYHRAGPLLHLQLSGLQTLL